MEWLIGFIRNSNGRIKTFMGYIIEVIIISSRKSIRKGNKFAHGIESFSELIKKYINISIAVMTLYKLYPLISKLLSISAKGNDLPSKDIFGIIGFALAVSTAIELLYMLITDGPYSSIQAL